VAPDRDSIVEVRPNQVHGNQGVQAGNGNDQHNYYLAIGDRTFSARTVLISLAVAVILGASTTLAAAATMKSMGGASGAFAGMPSDERSSGEPSAIPGAPTAGGPSTAPPADPTGAPFTVSVADAKTPCSSGWILPPGRALPTTDMTFDDEWQAWAMANAAVPLNTGGVQFTIQGRSTAQVVLLRIRVKVVSRESPLQGTSYSLACGGGGTYRYGAIDLDASRPTLEYVAAGSDVAPPSKSDSISFPYTVTIADAENFVVAAHTEKCLCAWTVEIDWTSQGRSGTQVIDNGGKPFHVTAASKVERHCVMGGGELTCQAGPPQ
jgi:hypothetical protein